MPDQSLAPHRQAINAIDAEILSLLNQRAAHARAIGELKGTGTVYRPERESQVLQRIRSLNQTAAGILSDEAVARLFREIMSECLAVERPLTIAYLGPEATFTQQAAVKHFGHAARTQPCPSIDECFCLVETRQADYAVAPVENSTEGLVGRTLDLMVSTPLRACGEVLLRIQHHLLQQPGGSPQPEKVYAHTQALVQCHEWLNHHLPHATRISVASNAEAARLAAAEPQAAAIAGQTAAEHYHLAKLAANIEDEPNNNTRFLIFGHSRTRPSGRDKTSLIVSAPNRPGTVHRLLQPFSEHGISMTKLESRPSRAGLWDYLFFIDIEGHADSPQIQPALEALAECAAFVKIIGAYPQAVL
ncbi:chorismate mutase [Eikenella sp. NML03-A-027]|uniref:prephenate dehydratase n=1 Tax=Eikenella sp. NML03-A-027 TaxID=1795828 RepID=UPI0007E264FF|nr:prephenate dehydratase [Eikenella sp. NML03-A-027]OAM30267.1 chorismate mutase [Eikenella sp. NML03-A-027]